MFRRRDYIEIGEEELPEENLDEYVEGAEPLNAHEGPAPADEPVYAEELREGYEAAEQLEDHEADGALDTHDEWTDEAPEEAGYLGPAGRLAAAARVRRERAQSRREGARLTRRERDDAPGVDDRFSNGRLRVGAIVALGVAATALYALSSGGPENAPLKAAGPSGAEQASSEREKALHETEGERARRERIRAEQKASAEREAEAERAQRRREREKQRKVERARARERRREQASAPAPQPPPAPSAPGPAYRAPAGAPAPASEREFSFER